MKAAHALLKKKRKRKRKKKEKENSDPHAWHVCM
jgi:hypothetical protein